MGKNLKKFKERPLVSAMLEDYYPINVDRNVLYIQSKTSAIYNEKIINKGKELLKRHLESMSKAKVKVEIRLNEKTIDKGTSINTKLKLENKANDEEIFNKVVDLFDGEILR